MVEEQQMVDRIASLALARFAGGGFAGTSVADLAGALEVSKAAIYYHYRSKDALLHRLVDPLLDAIDACIDSHSHPPPSADATRQLLTDYLTVLIAHREIVTWVATDVAVLNHPKLGPRIRTQNRQLRTLLVAPDPGVPATLRAAAALGAIWRPLITEPEIDLGHIPHRQILVDAALATLDRADHWGDGGSRRPSESHRRVTAQS
jgi:AcrR family transcriptional regulator